MIELEFSDLMEQISSLTVQNTHMAARIRELENKLDEKTETIKVFLDQEQQKMKRTRQVSQEERDKSRFYKDNKSSPEVLKEIERLYGKDAQVSWHRVKQITNLMFEKNNNGINRQKAAD